MGDTVKKIDWNPGNAQIWKGQNDWDPRNSTIGQLGQGNLEEAGRGAAGGLNNAVGLTKDIGGAIISPGAAIGDIDSSISGTGAAGERRQLDLKKRNDDLNSQNIMGQQAESQRQNQYAYDQHAQGLDAQTQKMRASDATSMNSRGEEDSFLKARNESRRVKGNTLFGGFNG